VLNVADPFLERFNSKSILNLFAAESVDPYFWNDPNPTPNQFWIYLPQNGEAGKLILEKI
jgi:hypothetical protein